MLRSVYAPGDALYLEEASTSSDDASYWPESASDSLAQLQLSSTHATVLGEWSESPPLSQCEGEDIRGGGEALEPSREPCAGEIPWADLVFWLGDAATGSLEACVCPHCWREWQRARVRRRWQRAWLLGPYGRLSSKVPVIGLPRIEGVN